MAFPRTNKSELGQLRRRTRTVAVGALAATLLLGGCSALGSQGGDAADSYPTETLDYIIPFAPGGSTDPVGREFSRMLAEKLGTTATVENMPGGDQAIGVTAVLNAEADGYTMGLSSPSGIIVQPLLNKELTYQNASDYTPVVKMVTGPYALLVAQDSPFQNLDELIEAAGDDPGAIRVGTTARMSDNSFAIFSLEEQADIELTVVPFPGGAGESVLAVLGGQIEAIIATASGQLGLVQSGDLRALAHTGTPSYDATLPGSVSFESAGFDIPFSSEFMTVAPAGLPDAVREKLIVAARSVAESPEWAAWCKTQGILPEAVSGPDLDQWIVDTTERSRAAIALAQSRED